MKVVRNEHRFLRLTAPSALGEAPAEDAEDAVDAVAFSTWPPGGQRPYSDPNLEAIRKGLWRSKIGVGVAIGIGIGGTRDGIRT